MDIYYERVNQRYRGPFEQEKLVFLIDQIKMNITALYKACEDQKAQIKNIAHINENQGFDFPFNADTSDAEQVFESNLRTNFSSISQKSISPKEVIRDMTYQIEDFINNSKETFK